ncbi:ribosomal protein S18-alanine N-acetyltransferase [Sulfurirhabdus autotrophica]|uniref:[Ribosomal protein bS18]-alanine N-acetyltransferase n=1 Tax=Sulfurirhabdus autotrophica TaxID=1706046 RepID=A0A4R3YE49_9PROT|nr:ribosomal protein S18-alanine N-acetyltransferase [Sulfurirhabdus autotrophica]TCV90330.1 [SSU ribosomal protein S18P]-alanine acetyltransferase [Sulfurirhabdus autotrophica]
MSAVLNNAPSFRPMCLDDLDKVMASELKIYSHPWTFGNFRDSLNAGYSCWIYEYGESLIGYGLVMLAAGEAHLLNVGIAKEWQRQGMGRKLMQHLIKVSREYQAEFMFLEVRPSNIPAIRLYEDIGFNEMAIRKNYYPAHGGREDAVLMGMTL